LSLDRIPAPPYLCLVLARFTRFVGLALLLGGPASAEDLPPVSDTSAELAETLRELARAPRGPEAELKVFEIFDHWDTAGPGPVTAAMESALELPRLSAAARERLLHLLAIAQLKTGDPAAAQSAFDARGFISEWHVAGPFDNEGATGFRTRYEPESVGCEPLDADARTYPVIRGSDRWRRVPEAASSFGQLHLGALTEPDENVCLYSLATVESETAGTAVLRIGAGGAFAALWNGREAIDDEAYRTADPDRFAASVVVRKGVNRLLVKTCSDESGRLGLYARVTDRDHKPWPLTARATSGNIPGCAPARRDEARPRPQATNLDLLLERARTRAARPSVMASASDYLARTGALHQGSHQARDLARAACERSGSVEHCLLWSDLALDRNERRAAIDRASASGRKTKVVLLALADLEREGPEASRARGLLERVCESAADDLEARLLGIEIDAAEGLPLTALARAEQLIDDAPGVPAPVLLARDLAQTAGAAARALELTEQGLEFHFDELGAHESLARGAAARGDLRAFERHRDAILALVGHDSSALRELSQLLEGMGQLELAEGMLRRTVELAPDDAGAHKALGSFLLRAQRRADGLAELELARAIAPQDAWLTDYLELLDPAPRFEEPYVVPPEKFLLERSEMSDDRDARYLVDNTVVRVFDSGLASRFTQLVVEVGSRAAAREWRQHGIQFSPDSQRVVLLAARVFKPDGSVEQSTGRGRVPIAEPWYRLYYDVEAEITELPPLEPGDVIELRYRVDDTAERNVFADYFGDLVLIHDSIPKELWRYALVLPEGQAAVFAEPAIAGLERRRERRGNTVVELFEARQIPPIQPELHMPGDTAGAAYLHVSTYGSWEALGEWYRGLIRNQLLPDARITEKVRELTAGLRDERDRVEAIYGWVVTATRYVGLEFGIHGYKPYRAPLVAARGFGDCKDKASLLVTMLREAGVEAELALVRTRSAGHIDELPASLSVFNHAIAYLPSLDLWLDGTAEHHGTSELPFEDQGVIALRIADDGAVLTRTPVADSRGSVFEERLEVLLDPDGEARIEARVRAIGAGAPALRSELEAERTRRERFEAALVEIYPGARLGELEVEALGDIEQPVSYEFTAFVPDYGRARPGELVLPVDRGLDLSMRYCSLSERKHDLVVGPTRTLDKTARVAIPAGHRSTEPPSAEVIESRFGKLELTISPGEDAIEIRRVFELTVHEVASSDYADFCSFARDADEALDSRITLVRKR
jgi:transglutaminase-like putative cysteine protease